MKPYNQNTVVIEVHQGCATVIKKAEGINLVIIDKDAGEKGYYSALDEIGRNSR